MSEPEDLDPAEDSQQEPPEDGLSLDDLSAAYAQLIDGTAATRRDDSAGEPTAEEEDSAVDHDEPAPEEDETDVDPKTILEAMLFVGNPHSEPLTSRQVAALMRGVTAEEIDELVHELNDDYDAQSRPYRIDSVGAG